MIPDMEHPTRQSDTCQHQKEIPKANPPAGLNNWLSHLLKSNPQGEN